MQQPPGQEQAHIPPPPPQTSATAVPARATNSLALVSLIAGVAGYVLPHPFIAGIVAIITGHMARHQIKTTGEDGAGLALIGLILGYVHLALSILLVLILLLLLAAGVAIFGYGVTHSG